MNKREIILLILIFILALTVRFGFYILTVHQPYLNGITGENINIAQNLVSGHGFGETQSNGQVVPEYHELPGYPLILALFLDIFGSNQYLTATIIFQIVLSASGVFLVFLLTQYLFKNGSAAFLIAFLWAIWWSEARPAVAITHDALIPLLILAATFLFAKGILEDKTKLIALSAVVIGLTSYIRSDFMLLPVFFAGAAWLIKKSFINGLKTLVLMGLLVFLVLVPWGIRNYFQFHQFILTRTVLWQSIWEGFGEFPNPFGAVLSDGITFEQIHREFPAIQYGTSEYEMVLKNKVVNAIKSDPVWYIEIVPKRLATMIFSPRIIGLSSFFNSALDRGVFLESHPGQGNLGYLIWLAKNSPSQLLIRYGFGFIIQFILIVLSTGAVIKFWHQHKKEILILLCPPLYVYLSHAPIYWEPRFLVAGEFPYLIFSSLILILLFKRIKDKTVAQPQILI